MASVFLSALAQHTAAQTSFLSPGRQETFPLCHPLPSAQSLRGRRQWTYGSVRSMWQGASVGQDVIGAEGTWCLVVAPPPPHRASWTHGPAAGEPAHTRNCQIEDKIGGDGGEQDEEDPRPSPSARSCSRGAVLPFPGTPQVESTARPGGVGLSRYWKSHEAGSWWAVLEWSAFDKRVQAPVNFTQTAFDRSLVIFGELSHKFVPSCCRNLLSGERGRKGRQAGRSSADAG